MLHRPTSAPAWSPLRWLGGRRIALTGPNSGLLRYVLIAAFLTAVGCAYLWQVNILSSVYDKTLNLQAQTRELEKDNVLLAEQLAMWSSPSFVDKRSADEGYTAAPSRTIPAPLVGVDSATIAQANELPRGER